MADGRTPVLVLTGFLGSGKTTLLSRLLRDPRFGRTAVVINEFGDVALDHDLVAASDERLVQLTTGCLCCAARGDLADTLLDLWARREAGTVPPFTRAVVETSGLADPAPVLHALMADTATAARYALHGIVALVDAAHGEAALVRHGEARRQVAAADRVLLSKTDAATPPPALLDALAALNPAAPPGTTADTDLAAILDRPPALRLPPPNLLPSDLLSTPPRHTPGLGTATVLRERPVPGVALALFLQALAFHAGPRLLRVKGLVDVAEAPAGPAVIHGVQHVFAAPDWLPAWPGQDRRTRLVVIGLAIPPHWPSRLLAAIEAEVRDEKPHASPPEDP